jgi:lipoprotein-anchoring transpeptidase ErfK/SrfK
MRWSWRWGVSVIVAGLVAGPEVAAAASAVPLGPGRVEGTLNPYVVKRRDSLRWIAVRFGVHPVRIAKPNALALKDGLSTGETIVVDQRRITPRFGALDGIVLNIPEASVYLVDGGQLVREYPVAVSTAESKMPLGRTRVVSKTPHPTWFVPKSIQAEMAAAGRKVITSVPPGPANPLGPRWIGVWGDNFGLHGTNVPTSIKHYASHGCVRFLAEDIKDLYARVGVGTPVHVLYQPVKLAVEGGRVWLAAYPDIYATRYDYTGAVKTLARQAGALDRLDWAAVRRAIKTQDGILVEVGLGAVPAKPAYQKRPAAKPTPVPAATPFDPLEDEELKDVPAEWMTERSPDPWFDQP